MGPELFIKALVGAGIVLLIHYLSKTENFFIAGLVPLFPAFALIAHIIIGTTRPVTDLKETILFGMLSLIPYFFYLLSLLLLVDRMKLIYSLSISLLSWSTISIVLVVLWRKFA